MVNSLLVEQANFIVSVVNHQTYIHSIYVIIVAFKTKRCYLDHSLMTAAVNFSVRLVKTIFLL